MRCLLLGNDWIACSSAPKATDGPKTKVQFVVPGGKKVMNHYSHNYFTIFPYTEALLVLVLHSWFKHFLGRSQLIVLLILLLKRYLFIEGFFCMCLIFLTFCGLILYQLVEWSKNNPSDEITGGSVR